MRVKRWVYICDHCGKEVLCPRCAAVYSRFKNEWEQKNDMEV